MAKRFTPEELFRQYLQAGVDDENARLLREYEQAVANWRLNIGLGIPRRIPEQPFRVVLLVRSDTGDYEREVTSELLGKPCVEWMLDPATRRTVGITLVKPPGA